MARPDESEARFSRLTQFDRVDRLCDAYEQELLAGQRPELEAYLAQAESELERARLLAELRGVYEEYARRQGELGDTPLASHTSITSGQAPELPAHIGRYRVERLLGKGGFGLVYLAHDERLNRPVAVKIPYPGLVRRPEDAQRYLTEARVVARLDHPHIVPVHDVGSTEEFPVFIVSKYVECTDLAVVLKQRCFLPGKAAALVATVADALDHAHRAGLVHRDVKPGNILIGLDGQPHVVDFGVALCEEDLGTGPGYVGTPGYMSPEQARGEGHRVDRQSDVFSLGVVFYELLAGRRPFLGGTQAELVEQISAGAPQPIRQRQASVPAELERICLKALAHRASQRYASAHDMADDLRCFLAVEASVPTHAAGSSPAVAAESSDAAPTGDPSGVQPARIVPKGLRSFDAQDSEFFLQLLPGPKDRAGLPDSLRFWKSRIESAEPGDTFSVGVMYGPSGCGKSSLVKAGLLPRLSSDVIAIYVEAAAGDLESRLLNSVHVRCSAVRDRACLRDALAALRQGYGLPVGKKLLLVVDQFEQWLHARPEAECRALADALRQCDGVQVQCILMIRDDFWLPVSRFLRTLDERFIDGHNVALVDLFDAEHATNVLTTLGAAFGRLPADATQLTEEHKQFLKQAIHGLAEDGKVICVRLALFAEMMKARSWTPAELTQVGGAEGIGCVFLEETFCSAGASARHRYHEPAARAILTALLPEPGSLLKGHKRTKAELHEASGYAGRQQDFDDVMQSLDNELRLITPVDPMGHAATDGGASPPPAADEDSSRRQYYQLTHDYLVPSLSEWLARKQKETLKGRAELLLADRSTLWNSRPRDRLLPSLWEYVSIQLLTDGKRRTEPQRRIMRRAGLFHGRRLAVVCLVLLVAGFLAARIEQSIRKRQAAVRAESLVDGLLRADIKETPPIIEQLERYRNLTDPRLREQFASLAAESPQRLRAAIGLLPVDDRALPCVVDGLTGCGFREFPVLRDALLPYADRASEPLWEVACDEQQAVARRFQAAVALAAFAPQDPRWANVAPLTARHLTEAIPTLQFGHWLTQLQPAGAHLAQPLARILVDRNVTEKQREAAAIALAACLHADPDQLVDGLLRSEELGTFVPFIDALQPHSERAAQRLRGELGRAMADGLSDQQRDDHWKRQSIAAVALVQLGPSEDVWPLLKLTSNPSLRSYIVFQLGRYRTDPRVLLARLLAETDPSARRALVQALGGTEPSRLAPAERAGVVEHLQLLFTSDPDPGIHSAASWTLRQWGVSLPDVPRDERPPRRDQPHWVVNGQGQTFAVMPNPGQLGAGQRNHDFAIACHEVTVTEFQRFMADHVVYREMVPSDDCPVHRVTWYMAAEYCNWLSAQEGIREEQWIYLPNDNGRFADGMRIKDNYPELAGYRLPTEAEWEFACRVGSTTSYHFGEPVALLERYAKYVLNASGHSHPVGSLLPNEYGLFDMHGNAWEWAHDVTPDTLTPVLDKDARVLRGGSFSANPSLVLSNYRLDNKPDFQHIRFGFRVARRMPLAGE